MPVKLLIGIFAAVALLTNVAEFRYTVYVILFINAVVFSMLLIYYY